jgi:formylmethanofuran dehydrogenase subunit C
MSLDTNDAFIKMVHETLGRFFPNSNYPGDVYRELKEQLPSGSYYVADVQRLIDYVDNEPDFFPSDVGGIAISALANRVMTSVDTLYCSPDISRISDYSWKADGFYLGKFLKQGKVIFKNDSCGSLGYGMSGGTIIVEGKHNSLDTNLAIVGDEMTGGEIILKQGILCDSSSDCSSIGRCMKGGRIEVIGDAFSDAGQSMTGGEIYIHGNLGNLGINFSGGNITVNGDVLGDDFPGYECKGGNLRINGTFRGCDVGRKMQSGSVYIANLAGRPIYGVGHEMEGGTIEIANSNIQDGPSVGKYMKGGEISFNGNCGSVGTNMTGGKISIEGDVYQVEGVKWGNIFIRGTVTSIGFNMDGGTVKIQGSIKWDIRDFKGGHIYLNGKELSVGNPISRFLTNWKLHG